MEHEHIDKRSIFRLALYSCINFWGGKSIFVALRHADRDRHLILLSWKVMLNPPDCHLTVYKGKCLLR